MENITKQEEYLDPTSANIMPNSGSMVKNEDGTWSPAKEEPYYNMGWEWVKCFFGKHEWFVSKKYRGTFVCFRCGKRKTGQNHY